MCIFFLAPFLQSHNSIDLVVSDKKIFKISVNENTLWTLAAMLDFKSAQKSSCQKPLSQLNCDFAGMIIG
jgi:hypothetical protein